MNPVSQSTGSPDSLSSNFAGKVAYGKSGGFSRSLRRDIAVEIEERARLYTCHTQLEIQKRGWSLNREADRFCECGLQWTHSQCEKRCAGNLEFGVRIFCNSRICPDCGKRLYGRVSKGLVDFIKPMIAQRTESPGRRNLVMLTLTCNKARFRGRMPNADDMRRFRFETAEFMRLYCGKYESELFRGKVREIQTRHYFEEDAYGRRVKRRRTPLIVKGRDGESREEWRIPRNAGWFGTVEVAADNNNLHFHALCLVPWLHLEDMKRDWRAITRDSFVLKLQFVKRQRDGARKVAGYVLKYITKPPAGASLKWLAGYIDMLKGARRLRSGGVFYNRVSLSKSQRQALFCPYCGSGLKRLGPRTHGRADPVGNDACRELLPLIDRVRKNGSWIPPPQLVKAMFGMKLAEAFGKRLGPGSLALQVTSQ